MSFLYFAPTGAGVADVLYAIGPDYVSHDIIGAGPGEGLSGKMYAAKGAFDKMSRVGYYPSEQTWRKLPKSECLVGYYTNELPTAKELQRPQIIPGRVFKGRVIPLARSWNAEGKWILQLPTYVDVNDDGEPIFGEVVEWCRDAWELSQTLMDSEGNLNAVDQVQAAWKILSFNYRVGPVECSILKWLEADDCFQVISLFEEWDNLVEVQKKILVDEPSLNAGDSA